MTGHAPDDFDDSGYRESSDPLEAIYALNIGDFVAEAFISDELFEKINERLGDDPEKLKRQVEELIQIYSMDNTLSILGYSNHEGFILYDSIATSLCEMLQIDACHLLQTAHPQGGEPFVVLSGTSLKTNGTPLNQNQRMDIRFSLEGQDLLSKAYQTGETVVEESIKEKSAAIQWKGATALQQDKTESVIVTPLMEGKRPLGLLVLESYQKTAFGPETISLARATGKLFVTAIRLQNLIEQGARVLKESQSLSRDQLLRLRAEITESIADLGVDQQTFLEELSGVVDARQDYTRGHSKKVAQIAQVMAQAMELNEKTVDLIYYAGLLGNLGRINVPSEILQKRDSLTHEEWDELQNHPNAGVQLLMQINFLSEVTPYIQSKHERWDGTGTPEGLSGRSIPLGSRILALADAYYAMTQERPYRDTGMSHKDAIAQLSQEAGTKWDPQLVEVLAKIPEAELK